jgi:ATP-dependent DNA ligase
VVCNAMLWRSSSPSRHPPGFIAPCLPTNGRSVPTGPLLWAYEIKHDGFEFIRWRVGDRVRVFSRLDPDCRPGAAHMLWLPNVFQSLE